MLPYLIHFLATVEHPVFTPAIGAGSIDNLKNRVATVMKLSEEELLALIPTRSGFIFVGCPNCDEGAQEGELSWRIDDPEHVFCRYCGMRYPNEKYPDAQILHATNPLGEIQKYPYWEDENGYRYFFQAKGWYVARSYFAGIAYDLAVLYHLTGESHYARRAALILDRFAQVYPGYCVTNDYPGRQKSLFEKNEPPYPYWGGKWSRWFYGDIPANLAQTYDLLCNSGELEKLAEEQGVDVKQRIENDFFRAAVEFVRTYPIQLGNMDPTIHRGLVTVGRVLGEPDYIHDAVDRITQLFQQQFFFDGVWREGAVSYHNQTIGGLRGAIALLKGYSDPPGYVHPQDGQHFENLDLEEEFPIIKKAMRIPDILKYPNGRTAPIHDTWAREKRSPTDQSEPMLLSAMGHARLGRGAGAHQIQVHLHFSGGYGHQHNDVLNIMLFAHGHELLSDIGYTHTRYRRWSTSTLAHNTVMVDGVEQHSGSESQPSDGCLLLYVPGDELLQAIEASGEKAYLNRVQTFRLSSRRRIETYRRALMLVGVSPENSYVVDIFRVIGGSLHEYVLHGDANYDGDIETDVSLTDYGTNLLPVGTPLRLPVRESDGGDAGGENIAYAFVRDVKYTKQVERGYIATFQSCSETPAYVRVHGLAEEGTTLFIGSAPCIRRADENDAELDDFAMPILIARREGDNLASAFVSVLEPYAGEPFITSVERLSVAPPDVAIKVTHGDTKDFIINRPDDFPETELVVDDIKLRGRLCFIRERNGKIELMRLIGGTYLSKGDCVIEARGSITGKVLKTLRKANGDDVDGFVIFAKQFRESGDTEPLAASTIIVAHPDGFTHGYKIESVVRTVEHTIITLNDDPGFEISDDGTTRFVFFPQRECKGENTFYIANMDDWEMW